MGNINKQYFKNYICIDNVNTNIISKIYYIAENQYLINYINKILYYIYIIYNDDLDNVYIFITKDIEYDLIRYTILIKYKNYNIKFILYHMQSKFTFRKIINIDDHKIKLYFSYGDYVSKKYNNKSKNKDNSVINYTIFKNHILKIKKELYRNMYFYITYYYNKNKKCYYCKTYHYYITNYLIYIKYIDIDIDNKNNIFIKYFGLLYKINNLIIFDSLIKDR